MLLPLLLLAAQSVDALIDSLGADDPAARETAERRLRDIGEPALQALDRAREHADVEVRGRAAGVARDIRALLRTHVHAERLRALREIRDVEVLVAPVRPLLARRVDRRIVGERLDLFGGREILSREASAALEKGGLAALNEEGKNVDAALSAEGWLPRTRTILVALPEEAYLILKLEPDYDPNRYRSRRLAQTRTGMVWGLDADEGEWWLRHLDFVLACDLELEPLPEGGLRVARVRPGSCVASRGFAEGDRILKADGVDVNSREDLERQWRQGWPTLRKTPPAGNAPRFRLELRREGEAASLQFMWLP